MQNNFPTEIMRNVYSGFEIITFTFNKMQNPPLPVKINKPNLNFQINLLGLSVASKIT